MNGKLIILEGPDGVGKSTQAALLVDHLKKDHRRVRTIKFPQYADTFFGLMIRQYLDGSYGALNQVNPRLVAVLFAADRWQVKSKIEAWLADSYIVIADRYFGSNIAYQAIRVDNRRQSEFIDWLKKLEFEVFQIPKPDLTIVFTLDVRLADQLMNRRRKQRDIQEQENLYIERVHRMYRRLTKKFFWRTVRVDRQNILRSPLAIHQDVWSIVAKSL